MNDRRWALKLLALTVGAGLAGCAALAPRTVEVSEAQLVEALAQQFPVQRRVLDVFDYALHDPQLQLMPETQRLRTRLAYTMKSRWGTQEGTLQLSHGLRLEPSDGSVRLTAVRFELFEVPGTPLDVHARLAALDSPLGRALAESLLQDAPVYRLKPKDLERARALGLQPGALQVTPQGLLLKLEPIPR